MYDLDLIKKEIATLGEYDSFLNLQSDQEDVLKRDPLDATLGNVVTTNKNDLISDMSKEIADIHYKYPIFDIPYINSIMEELGMTRTRLMKLKQKQCYTWHRDFYPRVHIPVVTDPYKCFMILQSRFDAYDTGEIVRMPADGNYYFVDTTKHHTAINGSGTLKERIHIVGSTNDIPPNYRKS